MVFLTSVLIVAIIYYLQTDGLIYATIIAVVAELINIFMTKTLTQSVEKKAAADFGKIIDGYKIKITGQKKAIKDLEDIQEQSINKIYKANLKIREYEEKLGIKGNESFQSDGNPPDIPPLPVKEELSGKVNKKEYIDLPSGSNRKKLPF